MRVIRSALQSTEDKDRKKEVDERRRLAEGERNNSTYNTEEIPEQREGHM